MKTALEGRMVGKKSADRSKVMLLDWMSDKCNKWKYQNVKDLAQNSEA